jgi:hypothetical protein
LDRAPTFSGQQVLSLPLPGTTVVAPDQRYGVQPLSFERNEGQFEATAQFLVRGTGYHLFLTGSEAVMVLFDPLKSPVGRGSRRAQTPWWGESPGEFESSSGIGGSLTPPAEGSRPRAVLRVRFVGANPSPAFRAEGEFPGKVNYFIGNNPSRWRTNIPTYARVRLEEVYPGIDLAYYGNLHELEYDLVVAPSANPSAVKLAFEGADNIEVDQTGELILYLSGRQVRLHRPRVYQELQGARKEIAAQYRLKWPTENPAPGELPQVAFAVAAYDTTRPLVIDPVVVYSTYLGGSGNDLLWAPLAVDSKGSAYIAGVTWSVDFPTKTPFQATLRGVYNGFVTKLSPAGDAILYSTYLGGSGETDTYGIVVDAASSAYVTGSTSASSFPTVNPVQAALAGARNVFVAKLSPDGMALDFSTYLGGSGSDYGSSIALDNATNVYVTGLAYSTNFPTTNAFQPDYRSGNGSHVFVAKLDTRTPRLVYSTYLGGSSHENGEGVAVDAAGHAYVVGYTASSDFPTQNAVQPASGGANDAFVAKFSTSGSELEYSTYLGGSGDDNAARIAIDTNGSAFVTGNTLSLDLATTPQAFQRAFGGGQYRGDAFVAKLNPAGSALEYLTYLGGGDDDSGKGIALDGAGNAYVAGYTSSADFPTVDPIQAQNGVSPGDSTAFVSKLSSDGAALLWSTYFGGSRYTDTQGVAVDSGGAVYFAGRTQSFNFPLQDAVQTTFGGPPQDAFVVKLAEAPPPRIQIALSGMTVVIAWPANATGFSLEQSDTLAPSPNWSPATNAPVMVGGQNFVTVLVDGSRRFFRLVKQ